MIKKRRKWEVKGLRLAWVTLATLTDKPQNLSSLAVKCISAQVKSKQVFLMGGWLFSKSQGPGLHPPYGSAPSQQMGEDKGMVSLLLNSISLGVVSAAGQRLDDVQMISWDFIYRQKSIWEGQNSQCLLKSSSFLFGLKILEVTQWRSSEGTRSSSSKMLQYVLCWFSKLWLFPACSHYSRTEPPTWLSCRTRRPRRVGGGMGWWVVMVVVHQWLWIPPGQLQPLWFSDPFSVSYLCFTCTKLYSQTSWNFQPSLCVLSSLQSEVLSIQ